MSIPFEQRDQENHVTCICGVMGSVHDFGCPQRLVDDTVPVVENCPDCGEFSCQCGEQKLNEEIAAAAGELEDGDYEEDWDGDIAGEMWQAEQMEYDD